MRKSNLAEFCPRSAWQRTARPHFERFLAAVQKILDEPTEPTETYDWFQDHSTSELLDPKASTGKSRLHSHIPFAVLSGGMAPQVAPMQRAEKMTKQY